MLFATADNIIIIFDSGPVFYQNKPVIILCRYFIDYPWNRIRLLKVFLNPSRSLRLENYFFTFLTSNPSNPAIRVHVCDFYKISSCKYTVGCACAFRNEFKCIRNIIVQLNVADCSKIIKYNITNIMIINCTIDLLNVYHKVLKI